MTFVPSSNEIITQTSINVSQHVIVVTRDKIEICLTHHLKSMEQRQAWVAPLGILLAIVLALVTSTFQKTFGISGEVWEAIFVVSGAFFVFHLFRALWNLPKSKTINQVIDEMGLLGSAQASNPPGAPEK